MACLESMAKTERTEETVSLAPSASKALQAFRAREVQNKSETFNDKWRAWWIKNGFVLNMSKRLPLYSLHSKYPKIILSSSICDYQFATIENRFSFRTLFILSCKSAFKSPENEKSFRERFFHPLHDFDMPKLVYSVELGIVSFDNIYVGGKGFILLMLNNIVVLCIYKAF